MTIKQEDYLLLPPVVEKLERPLWSVLIPTHNCAQYLRETLLSVLQQDPGKAKMEIIVVDDCSTIDDPETVVNEIARDRVRFIRQKENVGKVRNYETGMLASSGFYIHQLHGDDKVRKGFYSEMEKLLLNYPEAGAAFCRSLYINEQSQWTGLQGMEKTERGILEDALERLYVSQRIQTPAMVVKREVYETIGLFNRQFNCMEDWEMWVRLANKYHIAYTPEVLAEYRSHSQNATEETFRNGNALRVLGKVLKTIDSYVTKDIVQKNSKKRNQSLVQFLFFSLQNLKTCDHKLRRNFVFTALKYNPSIKSIVKLIKQL